MGPAVCQGAAGDHVRIVGELHEAARLDLGAEQILDWQVLANVARRIWPSRPEPASGLP
jgi:hypothetical protein